MVDQIPQTPPSTSQQPIPPQMPDFPFQQAPVQQPPVRPQQTANITKRTSKISMKGVIIGC